MFGTIKKGMSVLRNEVPQYLFILDLIYRSNSNLQTVTLNQLSITVFSQIALRPSLTNLHLATPIEFLQSPPETANAQIAQTISLSPQKMITGFPA